METLRAGIFHLSSWQYLIHLITKIRNTHAASKFVQIQYEGPVQRTFDLFVLFNPYWNRKSISENSIENRCILRVSLHSIDGKSDDST